MIIEGALIGMSDRKPVSYHADHELSGASLPRMVDPDRVAMVADAMPDPAMIADVADIFSLLGEPNRVRLLFALLDGPLVVRDLAAAIKLSESAVSHSLRLLRAHRVVDVRRTGRLAYYAITDNHVRSLLEMGLEHIGHTSLIHSVPDTDDERCIPASPASCN